MVAANKTLTNLVGGEVSPNVHARLDLPLYVKSLARCQNFIVLTQGGARFRTGSVLVKQTRLNKLAMFIPFQFNDAQSYLLEFSDTRFRVYKDNSGVTSAPKDITGFTNANPAVVSCPAHGFSDGDEVFITGVASVPQINGRFLIVSGSSTNAFSLRTIEDVPVDSTNYGVYGGNGTAALVYENSDAGIYAEANMEATQFTQNADLMYTANQAAEPKKITRSAHDNWSFGDYSRTSDFISTSADYPRSVCFTDGGRLALGGTPGAPETFYVSKAPDSGVPTYDDYSVGAGDPTDALIFTLTPIHGKVNAIQWMANTSKFLVIGTFGDVRRVYGSTEEVAISPTDINAKSVNTFGAAPTMPVSDGSGLFYIQRSTKFLRSLEFDINVDGYTTADRTLVAEHLSEPGLKQIVETQGTPDIIWASRKDGKFLGLTYQEKESISGWHQHYLGGQHVNADGVFVNNAKVLWVGKMSRGEAVDQLWLIVERRIGDNTIRSVEYLADPAVFPTREDFYTGDENEREDDIRYNNALFEAQKDSVYLDMCVSYDGSQAGSDAGIAVQPAAVDGDSVLITSVVISGTDINPIYTATAFFTTDMVGREIWKAYDMKGEGGGRARILEVIDNKNVRCKILSPFNNTIPAKPGKWFLTTDIVYGLNHMRGQVASVVADGGPHQDILIAGSSARLGAQYSKVHVGFAYRGTIETLNQDFGGTSGSAQGKNRIINKLMIRFLNSLGVRVGTSIYRLSRWVFGTSENRLNRPTPVFSGNKEQTYVPDRWDTKEKKIVIVQDKPLPCTILSIDMFGDTTDE